MIPDKVQRLNPLTEPDWDALLMSHPDYFFFQGSAWARVLHDTYGHEPFYFGVRDEQRLLALLPVMEVNSWLTGRRGVSLPFTDECAALSTEPGSGQGMLREALEVGKARKWRYLECKGGRDPGIPASIAFYSHTLDLSAGEERLFGGFESRVRGAIRKAQKSGLRAEVSQTLDGVRTFYSLHCRTRQKHGIPPQSFLFFQNIFQHIVSKNLGFVVLAIYDEKPVAASVFFHLGRKAIYKFGASDVAWQHLRGNNLVMWEAIRWYVRAGYTLLHFGRTSMANEGLRWFKAGFGAQEQRTEYFKFDFRKSTFVTDQDKARGWYNRIFHLLPVPLARMVGTLSYKHLA